MYLSPDEDKDEGFSAAHPKSDSIDSRSNWIARVIFRCLPSAFEIYHARDRT